MDKLRLRNYRCFDDTGDIELKPITLLLGANSSGKSSFIKFFPLLQQSLETRVNGLFLWDGQYVDFKDFKNTVRNGNGEIVIDYTIGSLEASLMYRRRSQILTNVIVSMTLSEKESYYDYLKELTIRYEDVSIKYHFTKEGKSCSIETNGIKSTEFPTEKISIVFDNNLLPSIRFEYESSDFKISGFISQLALSELNELMGKKKRTGIDLLLNESDSKLFSYDYKKILDEVKKRMPNESEEKIVRAANIQIYLMSGLLVNSVNDYFANLSKRFSYVLPLRSIMNRYYRFQNRNVDSIDPDGGNLAMFLNSLTEKKMEELNEWLFDIFKFRLSITKSEGHVELYIEEENKPKRNLVDVGFGFTQILPILTIIWKFVYGSRVEVAFNHKVTPVTIAIEQPELHLHPRFQAYFAQMLAKVMENCKKKKIQLRIIIETHSEVLINKLGQLIFDSSTGLSKEDVGVVLFNANKEGLDNYVHTTGFSNDGGLINWPFGFFSEDVY